MTLKGSERVGRPSWQERNKFSIQAVALIVIIAGSLALFPALNAGQDLLAAAIFAAIAASFAVTMWIS